MTGTEKPKRKKKGGRLLTRAELAAKLGRPLRTVNGWCSRGVYGVRLEPEWRGGIGLFRPSAVRAWFAAVKEARAKAMQRRLKRVPPRQRKAERRAADAELRRLGMRPPGEPGQGG